LPNMITFIVSFVCTKRTLAPYYRQNNTLSISFLPLKASAFNPLLQALLIRHHQALPKPASLQSPKLPLNPPPTMCISCKPTASSVLRSPPTRSPPVQPTSPTQANVSATASLGSLITSIPWRSINRCRCIEASMSSSCARAVVRRSQWGGGTCRRRCGRCWDGGL